MAGDLPRPSYLNRPVAKAHNIAYKAPPAPQNPIVRGWLLYLLAHIATNSAFVARFLWYNAGFGKLKDVDGLDGVEPRYDPTVVRTSALSNGNEQLSIDRRDPHDLLDEDFTARRPRSKIFASALDYHEAYKAGRLSPNAVVEALFPLIIRDVQDRSEHSLAFLETRTDLVRKAAEASTQRYRDGKPLSPLDGVPVAVKDEVDLAGYRKTFGSGVDFTSKEDFTSFCVQKWMDAGAIVIGKTSMHEIGLDTTNLNPVHGSPLNPYNKLYYPGGSSGGSAAAVGAGLVPIALGADGGGSIRIPSAYCGIYGLKPSHGRVSGRPSASLDPSTGVLGPMASNMIDLELAYHIMATPDPEDAKSALFSPPATAPSSRPPPAKKPTLGICTAWIDRADPAVQNLFHQTLTYLTTSLQYSTVEITLPFLPEGQIAHAATILAEIATLPCPRSKLTPMNQILLATGAQTPAPHFLQAQRIRHVIMQHLAHLYDQHPGLVVLTPVTPNAGWAVHPGDQAYGASNANMSVRAMEYVWMANFTGCPAISAPMGYVENGTVPVGVMGMGEWGAEGELMGVGYDLERYLDEGLGGGRIKPEGFVDVLARAVDSKGVS